MTREKHPDGPTLIARREIHGRDICHHRAGENKSPRGADLYLIDDGVLVALLVRCSCCFLTSKLWCSEDPPRGSTLRFHSRV